MEKIKITKIFRGKQETKFGEKDKIGLKTEQYGDKWVSSFQTKGTENWKEGDEVEVFIEKKGDYVNFTLAPKVGGTDLSGVEARLKKLEDKVFGVVAESRQEITTEVDPDDF